MTCDEFRRFLDAYLADELKPDMKVQLEQHALHCRECAREMERQARLDNIIVASFEDQWDVDLWPGIERRIHQSKKRSQGAARWWWAVPAAAALLLVAVLLSPPERQEPYATGPSAAASSRASVSNAEREYSAAIQVATAEFQMRKPTLPAGTVASVELALKDLNAQIAAIRQEWQKTPDDAEVATLLEHAYATKLDLLTRSIER